jgi:glycosyltransferase involved in cell wall biosynthesis
LWQVGAALWTRRRRIDIVHSFGRLAALLPVLVDHSLPKVQSYQREIAWPGVQQALRLAGQSLTFTACSSAMWRRPSMPAPSQWATVYNGVDLDRYDVAPQVPADAPLVFLGRIERIKGTHTAIEIARLAGRRLVIAGNQVSSREGRDYFDQHVRPHIDGERVIYVGPVDDAAKNRVLGSAAALLMPIEWEEPFGIVMTEAMACGTPVIGFGRGSVPEVIDEGVTGAVVSNASEAAAATDRVCNLDRAAVRQRCDERFSHRVIADAYEQVYVKSLEQVGRDFRRAG